MVVWELLHYFSSYRFLLNYYHELFYLKKERIMQIKGKNTQQYSTLIYRNVTRTTQTNNTNTFHHQITGSKESIPPPKSARGIISSASFDDWLMHVRPDIAHCPEISLDVRLVTSTRMGRRWWGATRRARLTMGWTQRSCSMWYKGWGKERVLNGKNIISIFYCSHPRDI